MQFKYFTEYSLSGKRVMLRLDLNVPLKNGHIVNEERINRSLPTIEHLLKEGASLILISHLGRPKETGEVQKDFSLEPVAQTLEKKLNRKVTLKSKLSDIEKSNEELIMLENIRFFRGESVNDPKLAQDLAKLCDVFVMDAFATSHRAHASTTGIVNYVSQAYAGLLIKEELNALDRIHGAARPIIAVLAGSKISTKLSLINSLSEKVDHLILGGGIANTCIAAQGIEIGTSINEPSMYDEAKIIVEKSNVNLPKRVIVAKNIKSKARDVDINSITKDDCIFDVSPVYIDTLKDLFNEAATIIWNGPMGMFEDRKFSSGTDSIANLIAKSKAYSIVGGGDTVSAASKIGVLNSINYVSTAGGAFIEYLEGKSLPALVALEKKALESAERGV